MSGRFVPSDRSIDDIARAMTSAPAPALRMRVMARLPQRRAGLSRWLVPAIALASVAVVTVAVVTRHRAAPQTALSTQARAASAAVDHPLATAAAQPVRMTRPTSSAPSGTVQPGAAEQAWQTRAVAALPGIDDLAIAPIQPPALAIPQLSVTPIAETAPLTIAPLDGDRRR